MAQRIYLIEDDTALRTELAHVLELSGYAVAGLRGHLGRHRGTRPRWPSPTVGARSEAARRRRAFHLPRHPGQKLGAHPHAHLFGKRVRRGHGHEPGGRRLRDKPYRPPCCSRICRRCYGAARALLPV